MDLMDALVITALGMGVVFSGLLLTAILILSFSVLPRLVHRRTATAVKPATATGEAPRQGPVPPDVLAVITTVLEVERRLYHSDPGGRLTIARRREEARG